MPREDKDIGTASCRSPDAFNIQRSSRGYLDFVKSPTGCFSYQGRPNEWLGFQQTPKDNLSFQKSPKGKTVLASRTALLKWPLWEFERLL